MLFRLQVLIVLQLMRATDAALYDAKLCGRDRLVVAGGGAVDAGAAPQGGVLARPRAAEAALQ